MPDRRMRPPVGRALRAALRLRCPNCGQGRIFATWYTSVLPNKVLRRCPHCGLPYYRESGYFLGGMIVTYILTAFTLLAAYLFSFLVPRIRIASENTSLMVWVAAAVGLTFFYVRPAYSLWLAADFWIDPWEPTDRERS